MPKRILHKFHMNEISGVDRMAQEGAKMVLMKRDDDEAFAKGAFMDAVTVMEAQEAVRELWYELWEAEDAMHEAICMIVSNPTRYPNVQDAIIEALGEYSAKVQEQAAEVAAAAVPSMDDDEESSSDGPTMKSDHSNGDDHNQLIPEEENKMSKNTEPTVETLTAELTAANDKLAKAETFGKLTDAEKAYYANLDDKSKVDFLKMDVGARSNILQKAADADPVVYTAEDGEEFRKSDDPRMVKMAKDRDEDRKIAKAEREKRESLELSKRADDELNALPGSTGAKVALLKAVGGIKDEAILKEINTLLTAANTGLAKSFETRGTGMPASGSAEEQLENLAKSYATEKGVPFAKAMDEVLKTDEGTALYTQTQS